MTEFLSDEARHRYGTYAYKSALYLSTFVATIFIVFPIYWMIIIATKPEATINAGNVWLPAAGGFTLDNFQTLITGTIPIFLMNTVIITLGTILVTVAISLTTGYGLARFSFRHKANFARFLLFGYMFSPIVLGLPLYLIWKNVGLLNTHIAMIIVLTTLTIPFAVWIMWKYIQTLPEEMEESAWVMGASRWRSFVDVVVPQTKPAIVAVSLFAFAFSWNDYTFAKILLPKEKSMTFAPGIMQLVQNQYNVSWGELMAVSLVMTIPPILFAYFLQSYLLKGFQIRSL